MENPAPKKPVLFGMDWIDITLAVLFIGLMAGVGAILLVPYGWFPGGVVGVLLIYLAWRRRFSPKEPPPNPPQDTDRA
jgi:hypothetical protein